LELNGPPGVEEEITLIPVEDAVSVEVSEDAAVCIVDIQLLVTLTCICSAPPPVVAIPELPSEHVYDGLVVMNEYTPGVTCASVDE
jgi:hypothetical protein